MTLMTYSASGNMKTDSVGIPIVSENDIMELMYQGKVHSDLFVDDSELIRQIALASKDLSLDIPFKINIHRHRSVDDMTNEWRMPDTYKSIDVESWFANKIHTVEQAERVADELALYRDGGLYPLLRFLIYLVDLMREHKIVWGVGRGSSVSSYCLFLIGIHKIDSMKYNLEIKEFLKWQNT